MWARVIELMLGLWLCISPFIFGHYAHDRLLRSSDVICGASIVMLALLSFWSLPFWRILQYAHVLLLAVGLWLIGVGYLAGGHPAAPGYQNNILLGLTLLVFAIIPNQASQPPPSWRRYYQQRSGTPGR